MAPFNRYVAFFCLIATLCVSPSSRSEEPSAQIKAGTKLLKQGDLLADEGKHQDAEIRYEDAFEEILPSMRKLPFKQKVNRKVTRREDMKSILLKEFETDLSPEEFRANELALKAFGLVHRELNLKELLIEVYSEEIAAFYDPKTKTMHLIKEEEAKAQKPATFFEKLFGKPTGFDKDESKTVIAHELTHALSDQHFDLDAMHETAKKNDDRSLAVSALIEGEATLVMMGVGVDDWNGTQILRMRSDDMDKALSFMTPFMTFLGGGKSLKSAPPIITESMLFPYIRGMIFCTKVVNGGGWKGLDDAYRNPPVSTEQILHPEKYGNNPDLPMTIDLGKLTPEAGWKEVGRNVLGEMQLAVLLRSHGGKSAAAGWDGDSYAVFENPNHELGLVWLTTWDSEKDATEFAGGYLKYQTTKFDRETPKPDPNALALTRLHQKAAFTVDRRGHHVAIIEGFSPETTRSLMNQVYAARVEVFSPTKAEPKPNGAKP